MPRLNYPSYPVYRVTLTIRPANRDKLKDLGGSEWLRKEIDKLAKMPRPAGAAKRVQTCARFTSEQHATFIRLGGANFLDALIENATVGELK